MTSQQLAGESNQQERLGLEALLPGRSRTARGYPVVQGLSLLIIMLVMLTGLVLAQSAVAEMGQLTLTWTDDTPTDHDGFRIERSIESPAPCTVYSGPFDEIGRVGPTDMTYIDGGLTVGAAYYYRVKAFNTAGDSDPSNVACATVPGVSHTLTVTKSGTGTGTITSDPMGIACSSTCSASFSSDTNVTLTATPGTGSTFTGWGGDCTGTGACSVSMTQAGNVTATFTLQTFALAVTKAGSGTGTVNSSPAGIICDPTCNASFNYGSSVTLTATPTTGSTFIGWGGDCTGTGSCIVAMTAARNVTATFTLQPFALSVTKAGTGSGTVTSNPAGIDCGGTCGASFSYGSNVTLTATAATGSTFAGWTGDCTGTGLCTVIIGGVHNVTATFAPQQLPLSVVAAGSGSGTVSPVAAGTSPLLDYGTSITLTATAATGSTFSGWSGDCTGTGSCTVTMTAARTVTATFTLQPFSLDVTKEGTGSGTVSSSPTGINCGSTCSTNFAYGTSVTLTAAAATGSAFTGWSGEGCSGTGTCVVSMTQARNVTATFAIRNYTLTITKPGAGTGTVTSNPTGIDCGGTCSSSFTYNTSVTLTAVPSAGSTFTGWSGSGCSGTGTCVVRMTRTRSVTATFTLQSFALTVTKAGAGTGSVTSSPTGIDCGSTCSVSFNYGGDVTLTANPVDGSLFTGWSGGGCTGTGTCAVTVTAPTTVTATFALQTFALNVSLAGGGNGSVTSTPAGITCGPTCSAAFNLGTSVTLTATPGVNNVFTGWSGGCTGTGVCTVSMTQARNVTATFLAKAALTSPAPESTLPASPAATFTWSAASGATDYVLRIGTTQGGADIYDAPQGLALTRTVTTLPGGGGPVFVRLYTRFGTEVQYTDYTFTAGTFSQAALISPVPGSTLPASPAATFSWSAASGATDYVLRIGTTPGGSDIYDAPQGLGLSRTVTTLPGGGDPVFVRLYTRFGSGVEYTDYTFSAGSFTKAELLSPAPGSTITGSSATFTWSAAAGATDYVLRIGTTPGGSDIYNAPQGLALTRTVTTLPGTGGPLFVRLYTRFGTGVQYTDYTFTAAP